MYPPLRSGCLYQFAGLYIYMRSGDYFESKHLPDHATVYPPLPAFQN